jgi:predicted RNA binding protein YcfA (HicA-like mRNA interferase family)
MGRLSGFKYREVARRMSRFGFVLRRQGSGSHEIWQQPETGRIVTIPNHAKEMPEGTLRAILRQAGINPEDFLRD